MPVKKQPSHDERQSAFVAAMNRKAAALGMKDTVFGAPSGLGLKNRSTTMDLLQMTVCAYTYEAINRYWSVRSCTIYPLRSGGEAEAVALANTTAYCELPGYEILGSKTGSWEDPGYTGVFVCVARHLASGQIFAGAIMGAKTLNGRFRAMRQLFDITAALLAGGRTDRTVTYAHAAASCVVTPGSAQVVPVFTKNAEEPGVPASTVKVMTMICACDCLSDPEETVVIAEKDVNNGSGNNLQPGDVVTVRDLMLDAMLPSSNTAATALAGLVGGKLLK